MSSYQYFTDPGVYQSVATGGDSAAYVYNRQGALINFRAYNTYNKTVFAQVFDAQFPAGVTGSMGFATGTSAVAVGAVPAAMLVIPTGTQQFFDTNQAHWHPVATGLIIVASSSAQSYVPIATGAMQLVAYYKT